MLLCFCVGGAGGGPHRPFEVYVDANMHEVTHFCLPHLMPVLKHTVSQLHEVIKRYSTNISWRFH